MLSRARLALPAAVLSVACAAACVESVAEDTLLPSADEAGFRYADEYPAIPYATARPADRVADVARRIADGTVTIDFTAKRGYLDALLGALDIDPDSQVLVFSKTSLNKAQISPKTPRAVYFNDDTYVARVPGAGVIEIAAMEPDLGPVFYVLEERDMPRPVFDRQTVQCLRCHDSLTMTGGGVPRFILGSGYIDTRGELVSHEGWILTDQTTPLKFRWGGWYVTGEHGRAAHLGNIVVKDPATLWELDKLRIYDLPTVDGMIDTDHYPVATSDIVALLVLEHQVHVQNLMTRVNYDSRTAAAADGASISDETKSIVEAAAESLVQALLFSGEPELTSPIRGSEDFVSAFERRGRVDSKGRSLRQFDLRTRLFRYPLSYLIHSAAFDALPDAVRVRVFNRLDALLSAETPEPVVARLSAAERDALREILMATVPGFRLALAAADDTG